MDPLSPPIAFSYMRFSHPTQGEGDTLRRQTKLRDAWCEREGVRLDTSLSLRDEGVSGFTGEHRRNPDRNALAGFVRLVQQGRIPRGSFLVVENLDRLSREDLRPALGLFLQLLDHGVSIVQLEPETVFRHDKTDPFDMMRAILELSRGHSESAIKSVRLTEAWAAKKHRAVRDGVPLTRTVPAWLELADGRFRLREPAAAAVRLVFHLAASGYGSRVITKKLNADGVPAIGTAGRWVYSYVDKVLANRAVVGEYTPKKYKGNHVVGHEPPIPGYFPAVVGEPLWFAARAGMAERKHKTGRVGEAVTNLFQGLMHDAHDGGPIHVRGTDRWRYYSPYRATLGLGKGPSFPVDVFQRAVLSKLREVDPREVLPADGTRDEAAALSGRAADLAARIEKLKAALDTADDLTPLVDKVREWEIQRKGVLDQLAAARRKAAGPLGEAWGDFGSLVDLLDKAADRKDARLRLRAAIRRIVEGVWCLFVVRERDRLAAVQFRFHGGGVREYLIYYRPRRMNGTTAVASSWSVRSFAGPAGAGELDLRRPADAAKLEAVLGAVDLTGEG